MNLYLLAILATNLVACGASDATDENGGDPPVTEEPEPTVLEQQLADLKDTVEKYRVGGAAAAEADGYMPLGTCAESSDGAMGIHYVNVTKVMAPQDVADPPILMFMPSADGPTLTGVEFMQPIFVDGVPYTAGAEAPPPDEAIPEPLMLFDGRPFMGPMAGHEPGMPWHFDQHIWLFAENMMGPFAPYNPGMSCDLGE